MEVGGRGRVYTHRYTVTNRMIPALRWAAMRAILMFSVGSDGQSHMTASTIIIMEICKAPTLRLKAPSPQPF